MNTHRYCRRVRPGFTMIELLVVLAIMGILISLGAAATVRYISVQKAAKTRTTIQKVYDLLQKQMQAVVDQAQHEPHIPPKILQVAGGDQAAARVMWVKLRLKQEFPVYADEAAYPWGTFSRQAQINPTPFVTASDLPAKQMYVDAIGYDYKTNSNKLGLGGPNYESSALLYLALNQNRKGAGTSVENALDPSELADTGMPGVKQIIDGWGQPIFFCRWPTGDPELNPNGFHTAPPFVDPLDPQGLLARPTWVSQNFAASETMKLLCHALAGQQQFQLMPTIYSAGPDGERASDVLAAMGVDPFTLAVTDQNAANDNVFSYRLLRLGASGN